MKETLLKLAELQKEMDDLGAFADHFHHDRLGSYTISLGGMMKAGFEKVTITDEGDLHVEAADGESAKFVMGGMLDFVGMRRSLYGLDVPKSARQTTTHAFSVSDEIISRLILYLAGDLKSRQVALLGKLPKIKG